MKLIARGTYKDCQFGAMIDWAVVVIDRQTYHHPIPEDGLADGNHLYEKEEIDYMLAKDAASAAGQDKWTTVTQVGDWFFIKYHY
jgi:hypothetical protein